MTHPTSKSKISLADLAIVAWATLSGFFFFRQFVDGALALFSRR